MGLGFGLDGRSVYIWMGFSRVFRLLRLTESQNRSKRVNFGYLIQRTELMTENFGFSIRWFGSVFRHRLIMPSPRKGNSLFVMESGLGRLGLGCLQRHPLPLPSGSR